MTTDGQKPTEGRGQQGAAPQGEQAQQGRQSRSQPGAKPGQGARAARQGQGARQGGRQQAAAAPGVQAAPPPPAVRKPRVPPTLLARYRSTIAPALVKEFEYQNPLEAPRITKVVLNIGLGEALTNQNAVERATKDLATIAGQQPVVTKAKRAIAAFKLREGQPIGVMVTLRGDRMWSFMERLLFASLPRIRDFRGVPRNAFDGRGNYALGIREHTIFPEIEYSQIDKIRGLQVNIVTTSKSDREAFRLLELMGMPFARETAG
ncbi:MAG: 50S ribosomal protein L5 [Dehalococcoidia bacterium]|nr:50S ribosomal protein L5 [Dehalococcoidia bacterium]